MRTNSSALHCTDRAGGRAVARGWDDPCWRWGGGFHGACGIKVYHSLGKFSKKFACMLGIPVTSLFTPYYPNFLSEILRPCNILTTQPSAASPQKEKGSQEPSYKCPDVPAWSLALAGGRPHPCLSVSASLELWCTNCCSHPEQPELPLQHSSCAQARADVKGQLGSSPAGS